MTSIPQISTPSGPAGSPLDCPPFVPGVTDPLVVPPLAEYIANSPSSTDCTLSARPPLSRCTFRCPDVFQVPAVLQSARVEYVCNGTSGQWQLFGAPNSQRLTCEQPRPCLNESARSALLATLPAPLPAPLATLATLEPSTCICFHRYGGVMTCSGRNAPTWPALLQLVSHLSTTPGLPFISHLRIRRDETTGAAPPITALSVETANGAILPKLYFLYFGNVPLSRIDPAALAYHVPNLGNLEIDTADFADWPQLAPPNTTLPGMERLQLRSLFPPFVGAPPLPASYLQPFPRLDQLVLRKCQLVALPTGMLRPLAATLTDITLDENFITELPPTELQALSRLTRLNINKDLPAALPGSPAGFSPFCRYEDCWLSTLPLLPPSLENLLLGSQSKLSDAIMALDFAARTPRLRRLVLSFTLLTAVPPGLSRHPTLEYLDLGGNPITAIPAGALADLPRLQELLLNSNSFLRVIGNGALGNLPSLFQLLTTGTKVNCRVEGNTPVCDCSPGYGPHPDNPTATAVCVAASCPIPAPASELTPRAAIIPSQCSSPTPRPGDICNVTCGVGDPLDYTVRPPTSSASIPHVLCGDDGRWINASVTCAAVACDGVTDRACSCFDEFKELTCLNRDLRAVPAADSIPSFMTAVTLSFNAITSVAAYAFSSLAGSNVTGGRFLILRNNLISRIDPLAFAGNHFAALDLGSNPSLSRLDGVLTPLADTLLSLTLQELPLSHRALQASGLANLTKLTSLSLANNRALERLGGRWLGPLAAASLVNLDLRGCTTLRRIEPGFFTNNLANLAAVNLQMAGSASVCSISMPSGSGASPTINCTCAPQFTGDGSYCLFGCDASQQPLSAEGDVLPVQTAKCSANATLVGVECVVECPGVAAAGAPPPPSARIVCNSLGEWSWVDGAALSCPQAQAPSAGPTMAPTTTAAPTPPPSSAPAAGDSAGGSADGGGSLVVVVVVVVVAVVVLVAVVAGVLAYRRQTAGARARRFDLEHQLTGLSIQHERLGALLQQRLSPSSSFHSAPTKDWDAVLRWAVLSRSAVEVGPPLGSGQFGSVFRGQWRHQPVAIKVLSDTQTSATQLLQFYSEAVLMLSFPHRTLVGVRGVVLASSVAEPPMLVMEYMAGGDLRTALRRAAELRDQAPPRALLHIAAEVVEAMVFLSSQGIVHRDLAARNVLLGASTLDRPGAVKLADFGLSRVLAGGGGDDRREGSKTDGAGGERIEQLYYRQQSLVALPVRWMAPEALAEGKFSTKSDVWAFGVLLWELFSGGATPHANLTASECVQAVLAGKQLDHPPAMPPGTAALADRCFAREPAQRPSFIMLRSALLGADEVQMARPEVGCDGLVPATNRTLFLQRGAVPAWTEKGGDGAEKEDKEEVEDEDEEDDIDGETAL